MADITLAQLTNATTAIDGDGVFDTLMQAVTLHIERQYDEGRITGVDFATVYLGSIQSVISESIKFLLGEQAADKQADLVDAKIELTNSQNETEEAKKLLIEAQTLGFQSDTKQKILKQMLDAFAVNLTIAGDAAIPDSALKTSIDPLAQEILNDVGSNVTIT